MCKTRAVLRHTGRFSPCLVRKLMALIVSPVAAPSAIVPHKQRGYRLWLPLTVAMTICAFSASPREAYAIATLLHQPRIQAAALLQLHDESLDHIDSVPALDFLVRHLQHERLDDLYSEDAMDWAVSVEILQWWRDCGLEHRYTDSAIHRASENGLIPLLQWWKDSGLSLKYTETALRCVSEKGRVDVLQWWRDSGLELKYNEAAMAGASLYGHVDVLQWWKDSGLPLKYDEEAAWWASFSGRTDVLQWWKDSGLEFKYDTRALDRATYNGNIHVLQWWKDSGCELKYSQTGCVRTAIRKGRVECLQWWKDSGLEVGWFAVPFAENANRLEVLEW